MTGHLDGDLFGLVGDGKADNSAGFRALRDTIHGLDRDWTIDLDPGHYCYADNTWWLFGDRRVTLRANGARLECVSPEAWDRGWSLLPPISPLEHWSASPFDPAAATVQKGTRFHSVASSTRAIELFEPMPMVPGEIVLLAGHAQQIREVNGVPAAWGWPPNLARFEYATIDAMNGTTVTLRGRTRHAYDESWRDWPHDYGNFYGAPRLFKTRFPTWTLTRDLFIERAVFVANRHKPYTPLPFSGLHIVLERCSTEGNVLLSMGFCEHFKATRCTFGSCEVDKLNRRVLLDVCTLRGSLTGHGGGWEDLLARDCEIMGDEHGRGIDLAGRGVRFAGTNAVHGRVTLGNPAETTIAGPVMISGQVGLGGGH